MAKGAILAAVALSALLGPALGANDTIKSGHISAININTVGFVTQNWGGYYGEFALSGGQSGDLAPIYNLTVVQNATVYIDLNASCEETSGYLLISNESSIPDLLSLAPGDLSELDAVTGTGEDSGTNTFKSLTAISIGGNTILNVPTAYPNIDSSPQAAYFPQGYLTDGASMIFAAKLEHDIVGFDGDTYDFQFLLPYGSGAMYYMYALLTCELPVEEPVEEPGTHKGYEGGMLQSFILLPPTSLSSVSDLKMGVELYSEFACAGESITGNAVVHYMGREEILASVITMVDDKKTSELGITLTPPDLIVKIPIDVTAYSPGRHVVLLYLTGADLVLGKTSTSSEFTIMGQSSSICGDRSRGTPASEGAKQGCKILGIDCMLLLVIIPLLIALAYYCLKRKKGYR